MTLARITRKISLAAVLAIGVFSVASLGTANEAQAAGGHHISVGFGYGHSHHSHSLYGYNGPIYHRPSVHYHRVYHPTRSHWTPGRGWHTHGHIDYVPHYVPGHFDHHHHNHIDLNPHFHD